MAASHSEYKLLYSKWSVNKRIQKDTFNENEIQQRLQLGQIVLILPYIELHHGIELEILLIF